jgi:hypothetical protein
LVFADDSEQRRPRRDGMDRLVAFGGFMIDGDRAGEAERAIEEFCRGSGFPEDEEFKWSPRRDDWMFSNLRGDDRSEFFRGVLDVLDAAGAEVIVVLEDCQYRTAQGNAEHEFDVVILFIERVENLLRWRHDETGIVIADETGGGRDEDTRFMRACQHLLGSGTGYVRPEHIAINVVCGRSNMVRLLQVADLVTSCVCAHVAGETRYAPKTFESIRPMLRSDPVGGRSIKLHPDAIYRNLYYWLYGDMAYWKGNSGVALPCSGWPYHKSPDRPG